MQSWLLVLSLPPVSLSFTLLQSENRKKINIATIIYFLFSCSLMANSAPYINIMITIGCIVMMGSSILLGIDSGTPQVTNGKRDDILDDIDESAKSRYAIICMVS